MKHLYYFNASGFCTQYSGVPDDDAVQKRLDHDAPASHIVSDVWVDIRRARLIDGALRDMDPIPTNEQLQREARERRNGLLLSSDWTDTLSAKDRLGVTLYDAWQTYRQALRDISDQSGWPAHIVWPTPPT